MGWFVFAIILGLIAAVAIVLLLVTRGSTDPELKDARPGLAGAGTVGVLLAALFLFLASFVTVSTKNVGIVTSFGRPVSHLDNGPHLKAPWEDVTEMDAAIQTDNHVKADHNSCISARIAHQAVACVDVSIRWRILEGGADTLFQNYRDFGNVRDSLVTRDLNAAVNVAFQDYDPLAVNAEGNSTGPSLKSLGDQVTQQMRQEIGSQVEVLSVIIPLPHFDDSTQGRINALQAQIAQTRIAHQAEQTALAQANANKALSASVSNDPNVLVSRCLDLMNEMISKGQAIPPGFSCWPGSQSPIVATAPKS